MIHTHLHWSDDLCKAPKGEMVTTPYFQMVKGQPVERSKTEHVPTKILALTNCGKVVSTYWLPEQLSQGGAVLRHGHWSGFPERPEYGGGPVRWAAWPDAAELLASHSAITSIGDWSLVEEDA